MHAVMHGYNADRYFLYHIIHENADQNIKMALLFVSLKTQKYFDPQLFFIEVYLL